MAQNITIGFIGYGNMAQAIAQTGVGRGATQQATTLKQESASSKMCWVRHRRNARRN